MFPSRLTRRCSRFFAKILAIPARSTAVNWGNAGPAPYFWMADQKDATKSPVEKAKADAEELRVIGVPRRRVDARAKVTGQTRFADDIPLPRMVHCKLLRSPHPHARIRKIDPSRALAYPGVY